MAGVQRRKPDCRHDHILAADGKHYEKPDDAASPREYRTGKKITLFQARFCEKMVLGMMEGKESLVGSLRGTREELGYGAYTDLEQEKVDAGFIMDKPQVKQRIQFLLECVRRCQDAGVKSGVGATGKGKGKGKGSWERKFANPEELYEAAQAYFDDRDLGGAVVGKPVGFNDLCISLGVGRSSLMAYKELGERWAKLIDWILTQCNAWWDRKVGLDPKCR